MISVVRRQKNRFVSRPAQDHVKMVEDIAAKDAEISCSNIREGRELATNTGEAAAVARETQRR